MKKTLLFWESNTTGSGADFLTATLALGWQPHLVCADSSLYTDVPAETAITHLESSADAGRVAALLRQIAPDAILTTSSHYVTQAARLARHLGLAGPDPDALNLCTNKHHQRMRLLGAGVPVRMNNHELSM